jgi:hypothetical protein
MAVEIRGYDKEKAGEIQEACHEEWNFEDFWCGRAGQARSSMGTAGRDNLCGGETEDQFAERLTIAIWKANKSHCDVSVHATYLEELPYDSYHFGKDEYEKLMKVSEVAEPVEGAGND